MSKNLVWYKGIRVECTHEELIEVLSRYGYVTNAYPGYSTTEGWLSKEESTIETRNNDQIRIHYYLTNYTYGFTRFPEIVDTKDLYLVIKLYLTEAHDFNRGKMTIHRGTKETPLVSLGGEFLPFGYDDVVEYMEQYGVVSKDRMAVDETGTLKAIVWKEINRITLPGGTIGKFLSECVDQSWIWVLYPNYVGCAPYCMDRIVEGWVKIDDDLLEKSHKDKSRGQSQREVCPSAESSGD